MAGAANEPPAAILDVGTNTVLMLVGRRRPDGSVEVVEDRATITRLGEGLGADRRRLRPEAIARTLAAIADHLAHAERLGVARERIRAVATAGVRMAEDAEAFLEPAARLLGRPIETISGEEEARLSYLSVAREEPIGPLRVLDIGGGSTELTLGRGTQVEDVVSFRLGSVHLWEAFAPNDPPGSEVFEAMVARARETLATRPVAPHPVLHAVAGTATTTAALLLDLERYDRDRVDGATFSAGQVRELGDALAHRTFAERAAHPCLPRGRADVIVAGVAILTAALAHCGAETLVVRDRGHRFALLP